MKFILILFVLSINLILGSAIYDGPYWNTPIQICGPRLGAEMKVICKGSYNDDQRSKPKVPRIKNKRAIVDECCNAMCTRKYLHIHYCGSEPKILYPTTKQLERMQYVNYISYYYDLVRNALKYPQPED